MPNPAAPSRETAVELYADESPHLVATWGIAYYLTPCCDATGKGSDGGTVCRSCYRYVDSLLGMGWQLADDKDGKRFRRHMLANFTVSDEALDAMRSAARV